MSILELDRTARRRARRPRNAKHTPGEPGVWVFIGGDMTIFAILFMTYLVSRAKSPGLFDVSQRALDQSIGAGNTLILLTSSIMVVMAVRSVRERRGRADVLFAGALLCGLSFSTLKIIEYAGKAHHGRTLATNDFFMYYFVLTGLHWIHLAVGMAVLLVLIRLSRRPELNDRQLAFIEGGACFWHMVDLIWIFLFPLLYLAH